MWLKMLKALASNFKAIRSVNLKVFDSVISAYHWPGPTKVLRPRLPTHAMHGDENVMPGEAVITSVPLPCVAPHPLAQLS